MFALWITGAVMGTQCKSPISPHFSNNIIIKGHVESVPDGKVYLVEARHWRKPIDSTNVKSGEFLFKVRCDSTFIPFMTGITYAASSSWSKINMLAFINEFIPPRNSIKAKYHSLFD